MANSKTVVYTAKLKDDTKKGAKSVERSMSSMAKTVGPLVAAAFGVAAIKSATDAYIRQENAIAQLDQRLKSTGGTVGFTSRELQGMAASLQKVTTFGDEATIEMQSLLLTFTQIRGPIFQGAQEAILNVAQAMGTDLKSAAIQVGKALNDPKGQLGALSRSGIQFNAIQKEQIKLMQESGDVAGAQAVILKELETQFGGAARAAKDTFGGSLKTLSNSFGDFQENVGKLIADAGFGDFFLGLSEIIDQTNESIVQLTGQIRIQNDVVQKMLIAQHGFGQQGVAPQLRRTDRATTGRVETDEDGKPRFDVVSTVPMGPVLPPENAAGAFGPLITPEAERARLELIIAERQLLISADMDLQQAITDNQQSHLDLRSEADKKAAEATLANEQATQAARTNATSNFFTDLRSLSQNAGREGFEIAKIAGISETVINTRKAAMGAYAALSGIPYIGPALGAAAAAAAIAAGAAQIKGISSQSYGSAGSVSGITGTGGGTPSSPVITQPAGQQQQQPTQGITVQILGNVIANDDYVQDELIPALNAAFDRNVPMTFLEATA